MSTLTNTKSNSTSNTLNNSITTSGNILLNGYPVGNIGIGIGSTSPYTIDTTYWSKTSNPLENLNYKIDFDFVGKDFTKNLLLNNIKSIRKNKMFFRCNFSNNRIQPYELIMKMIEKKEKFSVKIEISDILTINYINFRFVEIENNLNFAENCDFSVLKVKFKFDKILTENKKLSTKQLRTDKMKKIINECDND